MVDYNASTKRLVAGGKNGNVVIHELRANKSQSISAHTKPVTAVALSDDGKHLATYSADAAQLHFYAASTSFMGMGTAQIKPVKQVPAPAAFAVQTPQGTPTPFRAKLVWVSPKAVALMLPNGSEMRFAL
jgi:hypothetical protein